MMTGGDTNRLICCVLTKHLLFILGPCFRMVHVSVDGIQPVLKKVYWENKVDIIICSITDTDVRCFL